MTHYRPFFKCACKLTKKYRFGKGKKAKLFESLVKMDEVLDF
tara:strand:- start:68231 stop:68356 length:126 start_codon:yes stop_codon:yes gene_type:complete